MLSSAIFCEGEGKEGEEREGGEGMGRRGKKTFTSVDRHNPDVKNKAEVTGKG